MQPSPYLKHYRTLLRITVGGPILITLVIIGVLLLTYKTSAGFAPGEQLSEPPERRPAQYVHVCEQVSPFVVYITQGNPACFPGDTHAANYSPTVPGTIYSIPCQTPTGSDRRYVYVSNDERCPLPTVPIIQRSTQTPTPTPVYSD